MALNKAGEVSCGQVSEHMVPFPTVCCAKLAAEGLRIKGTGNCSEIRLRHYAIFVDACLFGALWPTQENKK